MNAVLRGAALGLVGCLALAGLLDPPGYVALLGVSSLLSAWGVAGKYTLIADLFPADQRVAGNTVFSLADQLSLMIGPALAGVVTALAGPAVVIALEAAIWVLLAVSYASAALSSRRPTPGATLVRHHPGRLGDDQVGPGAGRPAPSRFTSQRGAALASGVLHAARVASAGVRRGEPAAS